MKDQIIEKLFSSNWNYAWGKEDKDKHLIALFYKKGGFSGLHDFIVSEKERMFNEFNHYYSSDLIETLAKAKTELKDEDFREYIFKSNLSFNKNNFEKLEEVGLLEYFSSFSDSFRDNIEYYHKIGNYHILETTNKEGSKAFYSISDLSTYFETLDQALIYNIYNGKFYDTLLTLLTSVNK